MALGVVLAYFCHPEVFGLAMVVPVAWAVATTCLIASCNYVINEILDSPSDLAHPVKRHRPIPSYARKRSPSAGACPRRPSRRGRARSSR